MSLESWVLGHLIIRILNLFRISRPKVRLAANSDFGFNEMLVKVTVTVRLFPVRNGRLTSNGLEIPEKRERFLTELHY